MRKSKERIPRKAYTETMIRKWTRRLLKVPARRVENSTAFQQQKKVVRTKSIVCIASDRQCIPTVEESG